MHYIRISDDHESFKKLKEQLITENLGVSDAEEYLICAVNESSQKKLSETVSEYIWNVKFLDYVTKHTHCDGNCLREIDIIINTMNVANSFKDNSNVVADRLIEFIKENKELNIEGFMNFRLRDFLNDFDSLIGFYCRSYDVESEYFDFICTLKECMEDNPMCRESRELHIVNCAGISYILNETGEDITEQCIERYTFECDDNFATRDDKIVSTLISMAPKVLHLHTNKFTRAPVLYDTLKAIFACRVIVN